MTEYPTREHLLQTLQRSADNSVDGIVLVTGAMDAASLDSLKPYLDESVRALRKGGLLFVQGYPVYLPIIGVYLDHRLDFKYWIAIKSALHRPIAGIPSVHAAMLLFAKAGIFQINHARFPHEYCAFCGETLRDWGGKAHLMNPAGYAISDVWSSLPSVDNYTQLSEPVLATIVKMTATSDTVESANLLLDKQASFSTIRMIVGPREGIASLHKSISEPFAQYYLPGFGPQINRPLQTRLLGDGLWNVVHHGDALEVLKQYPDESVNLVFADPPYNLDKNYNVYEDERSRDAYLSWCNSWLEEYIRILKPTGSLYLLNLPRWTMYHAAFLNKRLYFQNWIVWDALSEPRGKIMPAHYGLLFYTKHPTDFTFNYDQFKEIDSRQYCLRASCIRRRKLAGVDEKDPLTDIWSDIHRLKHRRDRDYHPCQLPDALMERIIRLSSAEDDIVLDALAGTGTTAVMAKRLGRRYVAIDIDEAYVHIIQEKLAQVEYLGYVPRQSTHRPRARYSKKSLQLELQNITSRLGRLPTPDDVKTMSSYSLDAFLETFPTWGKALKAAKLEIKKNGNGSA